MTGAVNEGPKVQVKDLKIRILQSCGFFACFFLIGLMFGIIGPTLIDLAIQTETDLTYTSLILPFRAGGYVVGAFACTFIYGRVNVLLIGIIAVAISGTIMLLVPLIHNIWAIVTMFLFLGGANGVNEAAVNIYIIHLWGKEVTPYMQALHFFFGFGALISPLFTRPFLLETGTSPEASSNCLAAGLNQSLGQMQTSVLEDASDNLPINRFNATDVQLIYPYVIITVYAVVILIWFILMYIYCPSVPPHHSRGGQSRITETEEDKCDPFDLTVIAPRTHSISFSDSIRRRHDSAVSHKLVSGGISRQISVLSNRTVSRQVSTVKGEELFKTMSQRKLASSLPQPEPEERTSGNWYNLDNPYKALIIVLAIAFVHVYYGLELTFGSFLTAFSVNSNVHMGTREGAQVTSIFWAAFTFWRLFTVFYIGFTGPQLGILLNLAILAVGNIIMVPFGFDHEWALYGGVVMIGVGISPLWGSMFGFLELYFPVSSRVASAMMTSAAIGEFIFPAILAKFMECQSIVFIYITLICSVFTICVFMFILLVCKYKMKQSTETSAFPSGH